MAYTSRQQGEVGLILRLPTLPINRFHLRYFQQACAAAECGETLRRFGASRAVPALRATVVFFAAFVRFRCYTPQPRWCNSMCLYREKGSLFFTVISYKRTQNTVYKAAFADGVFFCKLNSLVNGNACGNIFKILNFINGKLKDCK